MINPYVGGAIISAAGALGGGMLGSSSSKSAAKDSADAARDIAKLQTNWAKEMAHNAHTYEVQDLKQAGLNPILSTSSGGAQGMSINPPMPDTSGIAQAGQAMGQGISSATSAFLDAQNKMAQNENIEANTAYLTEQKNLILQQTLTEMRRAGLIDAQKQKEYSESMLLTQKTNLVYIELKKQVNTIQTQINQLENKYKQELVEKDIKNAQKTKAEIDAKYAIMDKWVDYMSKIIGTAVGFTRAAAAF